MCSNAFATGEYGGYASGEFTIDNSNAGPWHVYVGGHTDTDKGGFNSGGGGNHTGGAAVYRGSGGGGYYGGAFYGSCNLIYTGAGGSGYIGGVQNGQMKSNVRTGHGAAKITLAE